MSDETLALILSSPQKRGRTFTWVDESPYGKIWAMGNVRLYGFDKV